MSVFSDLLAKSTLPEPTQKMIEEKLQDAFSLIVTSNEWVAQVNAAKAEDPNNTEYLDSIWRAKAPLNEELRPIEEQYQVLVAESEKLLEKLRAFAKTEVKPPLSEEETKQTRKKVNDAAPAIAEARKAAETMAMIADQMLTLQGAAIPGGIISLLPPVESLKNTRGRKAGSSEGKSYMTRVGDVLVDGKSTNRVINGESKGKFNFAADELSKQFGEDIFPDNKVTPEALEEAYFESLGKPLRSVKSSEIPVEHEFTFTKEVKVRNGNDDGFKVVPQSKKVKVLRAVTKPAATETTEAPKPEVSAETPKPETPKAAPVKPEAKKTVSENVKK